jgi:cytochrome-b5 reductase
MLPFSGPCPRTPQIYHVLNNPPAEGWTQGSGFITQDILRLRLPAPGPDTLILQCGPGPMVEAMKKHLEVLGYDTAQQFTF